MPRTITRLNRRFCLAAAATGALGVGALTAACGSANANPTSGTTATSSSPSSTHSTTGSSTSGAPTTASPRSTSTTASLTGSNCYVGNWTSTNLTQQVEGEHVSGGSGIHFSITSTRMSVNFSGMKPVTLSGGSISGQGIYIGQEQAGVSFEPSGTFSIPNKGTSNVTFEAKISGQTSYSPPIKSSGFPTGGISGTYMCSGSSLTLKVPTPQGTTTVLLARS